jgi:hypothetical protein
MTTREIIAWNNELVQREMSVREWQVIAEQSGSERDRARLEAVTCARDAVAKRLTEMQREVEEAGRRGEEQRVNAETITLTITLDPAYLRADIIKGAVESELTSLADSGVGITWAWGVGESAPEPKPKGGALRSGTFASFAITSPPQETVNVVFGGPERCPNCGFRIDSGRFSR